DFAAFFFAGFLLAAFFVAGFEVEFAMTSSGSDLIVRKLLGA
ncbi:MAG: cell division protein FtsX, partial [Myxococcota bacterium]